MLKQGSPCTKNLYFLLHDYFSVFHTKYSTSSWLSWMFHLASCLKHKKEAILQHETFKRVHSQNWPYDSQNSPYDSQISPYDSQISPYDSQNSPYDDQWLKMITRSSKFYVWLFFNWNTWNYISNFPSWVCRCRGIWENISRSSWAITVNTDHECSRKNLISKLNSNIMLLVQKCSPKSI